MTRDKAKKTKTVRPTYFELTDKGKRITTRSDSYGISFDGETGDYREEVYKLQGKTFTAAISEEFGFTDIHVGNVRAKSGYR